MANDSSMVSPEEKEEHFNHDDDIEKKEDEEEHSPSRSDSDQGEDGKADLNLSKTKSLPDLVSVPREIAVVVIITLAQFTTQCGFTSGLALTHVIGDHYHIKDPGVLTWLTAGYSLTVGTFILVSGRFGDMLGWKRMLLVGYGWFAFWTIVLGLAWYSDHVLFIFARVLQGLGPSICLPNALALLGGLYGPSKRKNMAFALFGGMAPIGATIGYVFAGLFNLTWWPWLFWMGGIGIGLLGVLAAFVIPDPQHDKPGLKGKTFRQVVEELDLIGAIVGVTALILFNFAWNQAPSESWAEPYIIVTLILGVLLIPVFFWIELKKSKYPLLPFDVFTVDNGFVLTCLSCGWMAFGIWVFYFLQILQTLRKIPIILQAAYFVPIAISGLVAALTSGRLLASIRPAWVMLAALCAFLTGNVLVATLPPHQIYWAQIFVTVIVTPWGMDMSFPSATIIVSNSVDKAHQGVAASLVNTIVNYSISIGLGFAGTVQKYEVPVQKTPEQLLRAYRSALYLGISLASLGLIVAIVFVLKVYRKKERKQEENRAEQEEEEAREGDYE